MYQFPFIILSFFLITSPLQAARPALHPLETIDLEFSQIPTPKTPSKSPWEYLTNTRQDSSNIPTPRTPSNFHTGHITDCEIAPIIPSFENPILNTIKNGVVGATFSVIGTITVNHFSSLLTERTSPKDLTNVLLSSATFGAYVGARYGTRLYNYVFFDWGL